MMIPAIMFTSCSGGGETINNVQRAGSGLVQQVHDTVELGKIGIQKAQTTINDVGHRAATIKEGVENIVEAGKKIKDSVSSSLNE